MGRTLDLPSVIEFAPCKYKRVYFYFGVQKKLITDTNFHHYIRKCIKCPVDLATAVEERNISQLNIKLQERRLNII
jgi:hypothetical protein